MSNYRTIRTKSDRISFQIANRTCWIILLLSLLLVIITIIGLSAGSDFIHPFIVVKELLGYGNGEYDFVLHTLRLPRILMALLVGAALGVAGLILQGIIRNPLAAPDIIGVTSGASMGAIIFIVYFMGSVGIQFLPLAAISGAAIISFIIYLLSWRKGVTPIRMVLIGIGISALAKAVVTMLLVLSEVAATTKAYLWLTGSLYGANMTDVYLLLPWVALLLPLTFVLARTVNVKELGDDIATGLGVKVQVYRLLFLIISVMLAGFAGAFAG